MRYLSVCSGIEAASVAWEPLGWEPAAFSERHPMKQCTKCGTEKPLDDFHRQPSGPQGRHSWCKDCANAAQRGVRIRLDTTERRRRRLLKQRYGLTPEAVAEMLAAQGGVCAICSTAPTKPVVDHDHGTGEVRGILCHGCNIKLPAVEDAAFRTAALRYLEGR